MSKNSNNNPQYARGQNPARGFSTTPIPPQLSRTFANFQRMRPMMNDQQQQPPTSVRNPIPSRIARNEMINRIQSMPANQRPNSATLLTSQQMTPRFAAPQSPITQPFHQAIRSMFTPTFRPIARFNSLPNHDDYLTDFSVPSQPESPKPIPTIPDDARMVRLQSRAVGRSAIFQFGRGIDIEPKKITEIELQFNNVNDDHTQDQVFKSRKPILMRCHYMPDSMLNGLPRAFSGLRSTDDHKADFLDSVFYSGQNLTTSDGRRTVVIERLADDYTLRASNEFGKSDSARKQELDNVVALVPEDVKGNKEDDDDNASVESDDSTLARKVKAKTMRKRYRSLSAEPDEEFGDDEDEVRDDRSIDFYDEADSDDSDDEEAYLDERGVAEEVSLADEDTKEGAESSTIPFPEEEILDGEDNHHRATTTTTEIEISQDASQTRDDDDFEKSQEDVIDALIEQMNKKAASEQIEMPTAVKRKRSYNRDVPPPMKKHRK